MFSRSCIAGVSILLSGAATANAQTYHDSSGAAPAAVVPLIGCSPNGICAGPVSLTNPMPVAGTFAVTLSGFTPNAAYATPLSAGTSSNRVGLPAGPVVIVYNTGLVPAYVQLGGSTVAAATSNDVIQPNSWMAFSVGANTFLAAITTSGATTLNISGGAGLPAGAGGGGGGSGGTLPTGVAGTPNAAVVSVQGIAGGTPAPVSLVTLPSLPPGSNTIGSVNISSLPSLPNGSNTIGSIANSSFSLSGTLPGFTSTPTVNSTESGVWNIANITGTVTLPTGAATATNQTNVESVPGASATTAITIQGSPSGVVVPVSLNSVPPLSAGTNAIGAITNTNFGGFDSGAVRASATPATSAHSAGQVVGGLFALPIARTNGGSGIVTSILGWSSWGSTNVYNIRVWQKNPTNTTCVDGANFVSSAVDDASLIGAGPTAIAFVAPGNSTGDTKTYASLTTLSWDYKNSDTIATPNLYACLVTNASDTPGASATLSLSVSGPQN